jgi:hypothetical protein
VSDFNLQVHFKSFELSIFANKTTFAFKVVVCSPAVLPTEIGRFSGVVRNEGEGAPLFV